MPKDDFAKARAKEAPYRMRIESMRRPEPRPIAKAPIRKARPPRPELQNRRENNLAGAALTIQQIQALMLQQGRLRIGGGLNKLGIIKPTV